MPGPCCRLQSPLLQVVKSVCCDSVSKRHRFVLSMRCSLSAVMLLAAIRIDDSCTSVLNSNLQLREPREQLLHLRFKRDNTRVERKRTK